MIQTNNLNEQKFQLQTIDLDQLVLCTTKIKLFYQIIIVNKELLLIEYQHCYYQINARCPTFYEYENKKNNITQKQNFETTLVFKLYHKEKTFQTNGQKVT
eukprot:EC097295.1.p4 GENE.EC097295.1~~EC097295.1.p4  ORF type:complete len:101 (-),score=5.80 EC097295.1:107-409(-)